MEKVELKELLSVLEQQGWQPMLCNRPVPVSESPVKCGTPTEMNDDSVEEYVLLPKELVGLNPFVLLPVKGESMKDAGYEEGDRLRVQLGVSAYDGDDVFVWVDGACTVKTLYTDEDGQKWLVPQNDTYDAILLTEDMDVRVFGVVRGVEKSTSRPSSRKLMQSIRRTKDKQKKAERMSDKEVDKRIVAVSDKVMHARQWYAVFRALLDRGLVNSGEFLLFCTRVKRLLPEHKHLPEAKEISRMAVQSFSKPVAMWTENDAPVSGVRYQDYLNIALTMGIFLSER